ncbi:bis(5'-nucleosyl)-tetraphosphatase [asymmetrical] isoform X2 [Clupea harengus]|uniref:bis(5'-nucleosyl)-tetraphosphatase (asymmetrical) n=1 Tax=Clupea harengus TaxID=7950 RepID=A0A8M1KEF1_CLUHA|nr:bis(5'-nucleosyl)-tetraphosphatase [asymmetrical] isoform X2 [Clupea harengus]
MRSICAVQVRRLDMIESGTVHYLRYLSVMALRACGFIIFRRLAQSPPDNIEYLLLQTSYGEHHWTPPKGHVDPGEDDLTTALRETREEAGLGEEHLRIANNFLKELRYQVRGKDKTVLYWLAELRDPAMSVTLSEEHQDHRWAHLEEACKLASYKDLQETLREAQHFLETGEKKE